MDSDNLSKAIIIGVTTLIGVMTISAIIIFFNSSLDVVKKSGSGKNFEEVKRSDIESILLMSETGNYIKGTNVINLINYYEENINVAITVQNVKYISSAGNIESIELLCMDSNEINTRESAYNTLSRVIMANQDFLINVNYIDEDLGSMNITITGV